MMKTKMILVAAILLMTSSAFSANVLLITRGNAGDDDFTSDVLINQGGHTVTLIDADDATTPEIDTALQANDVVVIGESVSSGTVANDGDALFGANAIPIINCEPFIEDDFGLAVNGQNSTDTQILIADATSPLAAGYSNIVQVVSEAKELCGSNTPGAQANVVGGIFTVGEGLTLPVLWYYTPGIDFPITPPASVGGATSIPVTYIHFFLHSSADGIGGDLVATQVTADMLLAAVDFAIDVQTGVDDWRTME